MPSTVISILRSGVTASGVYPTFAAWRAALPANLVTADQNHILNVEAVAGGYSESLSFSGITTDPTRNILIQAAAGHRHTGVYDETKALLKLPATHNALYLLTQNITIKGMQIQQSGGTSTMSAVAVSALGVMPADNLVTLDGCIFRGSASGSHSGGSGLGSFIHLVDNTAGSLRRLLLRSSLLQDIYNSSFPTTTGLHAVRAEKGRLFAYNNTIVNCSTGILSSNTSTLTTAVLKNNLVACKSSLAGRIDYTLVASTIDAASSNNASSDATAPGTSARVNQTFTFMGADNYHLAPGDTGALGFGLDLSADASFPTTLDIDDSTFTAPWSIGADSSSIVVNTVTVTTPAGQIRQSVGGTATISVTGTYAGTLTAIKARLVLHGTSTPVSGFDWVTKVATPAGNAFSFTFEGVPRGGWYNVQVQDTVDATVTSTGGKVGVGELIGVIGQSNVGPFIGNGSYASSDLVRQYTTGVWNTASAEGAGSMATALANAIGCPVGIVASWQGGTSISTWNASLYSTAMTLFNSLGGKLGAMVMLQGEVDCSGTTYATYLAGLQSLFDTKFRTLLGQPDLPVVIVANGSITSVASESLVTYGQIKQAHYDYGDSGPHNYTVDRIDAVLGDGLHMTVVGALVAGQRAGQALLVDYGFATEYRGPAIASIKRTAAATFEVTLTHRLGSDITPSTGITGFKAFDPGAADAEIAISSAVRASANKLTLTLATTPVALPRFTYADGYAPVITALARDNSALSLPIDWNPGVVAVAGASTVAVNLTTNGSTPAASLTTLKWAFFDQATPGAFTAPSAQGTAETTDASGNLVLDVLGTTLGAGDAGWLIVTDSDGTVGMTHKAFSGPVVVS